jgi:bromodomain adjacent to zinc finger domain protein 1A
LGVILQAPDYFDIIKTPMDLQTIKSRLNKLEYADASDVITDIGLIFANCFIYNQPTAQQYVAGQKLQTFFKRRARELGLKVDSPKKESALSKSGGGRKR